MLRKKTLSSLCRLPVVAVVAVSMFCLGYKFSKVQTIDRRFPHIQSPWQLKMAMPKDRCPSVLEYMTQGHWKTRNLTEVEQKLTNRFYYLTLRDKGLPTSLQRSDGRCGNVGYPKVTKYIRAVCNPTGPTPCCYNFKCVDRTQEQCRCKHCYDIRQEIHAEYSKWIPSDPRCIPKEHTAKESCDLLNGGKILFLGDSITRHLYTGFLMTVRGNFQGGGLKPSDPKEWKVKCGGMNMYEERTCRLRLDATPTNVCQGRVVTSWTLHYVAAKWKDLIYHVTDKLASPKTLFVVGIGLHNNCNATVVKMKYLKPTLDTLKNVGILWPKFIFVDVHAPGVLKQDGLQSKPYVLRFNKEIEEFLETYNIPMLKTFNMTDGVRSFDGTHHGLGVNVLKARIILNYIQELRDNGFW